MQKLVFFGLIGLVILIACSKDNIETTPHVEIKSINPSRVPQGFPLEILLSFTDKQGDIDTLYLKKIRINQMQVPTVEGSDTIDYKIPEFPEKSKGELRITLPYATHLVAAQDPPDQPDGPNGKEPDSLVFKFIVMDRGKNLSDTLTSDLVIVER